MKQITQSVAAFFLSFALACSADVPVEGVTRAIVIPEIHDDPAFDYTDTRHVMRGPEGTWFHGVEGHFRVDSIVRWVSGQPQWYVWDTADIVDSMGITVEFRSPTNVLYAQWNCVPEVFAQPPSERMWRPGAILSFYYDASFSDGSELYCSRFPVANSPIPWPSQLDNATSSPQFPPWFLATSRCREWHVDYNAWTWSYFPGPTPDIGGLQHSAETGICDVSSTKQEGQFGSILTSWTFAPPHNRGTVTHTRFFSGACDDGNCP